MLEMKQDTSRLPMELTKLQSVSAQLKLDELSTLSRMAGKTVPAPPTIPPAAPSTSSVITESSSGVGRSHSSTTGTKDQTVAKQQHHQVVLVQGSTGGGATSDPQFQLTYASNQSALVYPSTSTGTAVQLAMAGQPAGLAMTPEGVIVYSVAPGGMGGAQFTTIQQSSSGGGADTTVTSSQAGYAAAISVPSYVDGNLYLSAAGQTVQLMPMSGYWPAEGAPAAVAMVQQGNQAILQPVQYGVATGNSSPLSGNAAGGAKPGKRGIITID